MEDPTCGAEPLIPRESRADLIGCGREHVEAERLRERHRLACGRRELGVPRGHVKALYWRSDRGRYAACVAFLDTAGPRDELSPDRAWWLRVPAVMLSPRPVFFALREDDPEDVVARSEPVLLLVWLAGAASVLASPTAGGLLDNPDYDAAVFAVWTFIAGGIYGAVGYFVLGFALYFGALLLGSEGSFQRERQIVAFAAVPLALSFLLVLPLRLALFGGDTFQAGGADEGVGEAVLLALQLGFAGWSTALVVVGVRVVHGWSWPRALGAVGAGVALLAAIVAAFAVVF